MKILNIILLINFLISADYNQFIFHDISKYRVLYYYLNKENRRFVVELEDQQKKDGPLKYYLFTNNHFKEIKFEKSEYDIVYWNNKNDLNKKYLQIKNITKASRYAEIEQERYIISIEDMNTGVEDLYNFNGKSLTKINLGKVRPEAYFTESFLYYDKETYNLYFPGYSILNNSTDKTDRGIYVYNVNSKKVVLFLNAQNNCRLTCPYRVPNTNKIIVICNYRDHDVVISKEALTSI